MLSGIELGRAIEQAINKKISLGSAKSKAEIARHFKIKAPSIHDWIKKGSISKEKLPELWNYFSDVVGPEHWGLEGYPINYNVRDKASSHDGWVELSNLYNKSPLERQVIVDFILRQDCLDNPEWADSDARAYIDSLESKARKWLQQKGDEKNNRKASA